MKAEDLRKNPRIHQHYLKAATAIRDWLPAPESFPTLEHEWAPLAEVLSRQAELLIISQDKAASSSSLSDPDSPSEGDDSPNRQEDRGEPPRKAQRLDRSDEESSDEQIADEERADEERADEKRSVEPSVDRNLIRIRIEMVFDYAHGKLYSYRFDQVPEYWQCLYTDTLILDSFDKFLCLDNGQEGLDSMIKLLDQALINTGGQSFALEGLTWIREMMELLGEIFVAGVDAEGQGAGTGRTFSKDQPFGCPGVKKRNVLRREPCWTLAKFQEFLLDHHQKPIPLVFNDVIQAWPALNERSWDSPDYLLAHTLGGRRRVPIEVGRSYIDDGWGQELISFKDFMDEHILGEPSPKGPGYLAQYDLFEQLPSLRKDIQVPDLCWTETSDYDVQGVTRKPKLDVPSLNAWFGPAGTTTPLHTDAYHNLLCQVVGSKYVRLYPPSAGYVLRPLGKEDGIDMSNTSSLDLGVIEGWDERPEDMDEENVQNWHAELKTLEYREAVLEPGDTLFIPMGWWHYVRGVSVSFSVSFWWN